MPRRTPRPPPRRRPSRPGGAARRGCPQYRGRSTSAARRQYGAAGSSSTVGACSSCAARRDPIPPVPNADLRGAEGSHRRSLKLSRRDQARGRVGTLVLHAKLLRPVDDRGGWGSACSWSTTSFTHGPTGGNFIVSGIARNAVRHSGGGGARRPIAHSSSGGRTDCGRPTGRRPSVHDSRRTMAARMSGGGYGPANLPYGVFRRARRAGARGRPLRRRRARPRGARRRRAPGRPRRGVRAARAERVHGARAAAWAQTRERLQRLVSGVDAEPRLIALDEVELLLPFTVADYVDFWSSIEHAANSGRIFRPGSDPLPPNWRPHADRLPRAVGNGRCRRGGGAPAARPEPPGPRGAAVFGPSAKLDVELELGFVIGTPSALGRAGPRPRARPITSSASCLLNDWSARDVQAFESQPLGPFLGKSFPDVDLAVGHADGRARAVSRRPAHAAGARAGRVPARGAVGARHRTRGRAQRRARSPGATGATSTGASRSRSRTSRSTARRCAPADLLGSGTISGPAREERGCLLELSWNGAEPIELGNGERRTFLEDGDEVVLRGIAGDGDTAVALGEVRGRVVEA